MTKHRVTRPRTACVAGAILGFALAGDGQAVDVYSTRFDSPRIYFVHATLNRSGTASALQGQDNFLTFYMPPIDNAAGEHSPDALSYSVFLPGYIRALDVAEEGLSVTRSGGPADATVRVDKTLDAETMRLRCFRAAYGATDTLWFRIREQDIPAEPQEIRVTIYSDGKPCFTDQAHLRVLKSLEAPPPVAPKHFRFWLHYGPHVRRGHWDEAAEYLRKAGINTIQFTLGGPDRLEYVKAMRQRGFHIIAQRSASYATIYRDHFRGCLERGPAWFREVDTGTMDCYLPLADTTLWDFEPSPMRIETDPWTLERFREAVGIAEAEELTEASIKQKYFERWIEFRQDQFAACVKHWADFCRSVKPSVETILTEGRANVFDPPGQIDYRKVCRAVTFCDPMNFAGLKSVHVLSQWMRATPDAQFTGCQNVGLSSYHNVFIPPRTIMLQILSAALIGARGTAIYPGPAMDAENFVHFNRVMGFLGRHQEVMFAGVSAPAELTVQPVPKEDFEIRLGSGRTIRNTYPDWSRDAIIRSYASSDRQTYLAVVANWNSSEPCYLKIRLRDTRSDWLVTDGESRQAYCLGEGAARPVPAGELSAGITLSCPPYDFRGFVLQAGAQLAAGQGWRVVDLATLRTAADAYAASGNSSAGLVRDGDMAVDFDDVDGDEQFEYVVRSPGQTVWVSQQGTVLKWRVGDCSVTGTDMGLLRDMIWLPQAERANRDMDATMQLVRRQVDTEGVQLAFAKAVSLSATGAQLSLKFEKTLSFSRTPGINVAVRVLNDSLAMGAAPLALSYRVHSHIDYGKDKSLLWVSDGTGVTSWDDVGTSYSVVNAGLDSSERAEVFAQCAVEGPQQIETFGDYLPRQRALLTVRPEDPARLLQLLRWRRSPDVGGSGTIEWMYRPSLLPQGAVLDWAFRVDLQAGVAALPEAGASSAAATPLTRASDPDLLFHADFEDSADARFSRGDGQAVVSGQADFVSTPGGKGLRVTEGTQISYRPDANIDLQQGKLYIRFKPLWHGTDGKTHYLLTVRPIGGFIYLGKLDDGRFLLNMFDRDNRQHYPWHLVRTMAAETWHEVTVTWDAAKGLMILFLDGENVAEHRGEPWQMGGLSGQVEHCRIVIPETAAAVIDDLKIWGRP